jgi:hypothetical protein
MEPIIDDFTPVEHEHVIGGCRGLIPRDYSTHPVGFYASAPRLDIPLIPRSEWSARIKEMEQTQSRLSDIRLRGNFGGPIPSLDQNANDGTRRWGYCWAHSTTHAVMICRAVANLPYVSLSAFAVAATIKNGRNEGGWGAESLDFITERGVPDQKFWPQKNVDLRNGTAECWADAAKHKAVESWADLEVGQYDRNLTFDQVATLLLSRVPVVGDFNWWGHSICLLDLVETSPGQFGVRFWNSWSDDYGDRGMAILSGSRAIPDGAVAPRSIVAA